MDTCIKGVLLKILVLSKSFPCDMLTFLYIPILFYFPSHMFSPRKFSVVSYNKKMRSVFMGLYTINYNLL